MNSSSETKPTVDIPVTELLCDFTARLKPEDIPSNVKDTLRLFMLDYFASVFAGQMVNRTFNEAVQAVLLQNGSGEQSTAYFCPKKLSAPDAAFLNACLAHGADMDDGNKQAMGHIGASVFSAVLALAECRSCTEEEVITAAIVGYEVFCRLSAAVQPGLIERGFHATGVVGSVAVACACAKLLGLGYNGIYQALSLASIQASGLLIVTESGQSVKPLNPANAARTGLLSALLAEKGVCGSDHPLESVKGWCHAMSGNFDSRYITDRLGEHYSVCDCYIKPYPSCRHTHCVIEAASHLQPKVSPRIEEIDRIDMYLYEAAIKVASVVTPINDDQMKFSVYYALSKALLNGGFSFSDLHMEELTQKVTALIKKIRYIPDPTLEDRSAGIRGTRIVVHFRDGSEESDTVLRVKGDPENPLSFEEVSKKLYSCAAGTDKGLLSQLAECVEQFGKKNQFSPFKLF